MKKITIIMTCLLCFFSLGILNNCKNLGNVQFCEPSKLVFSKIGEVYFLYCKGSVIRKIYKNNIETVYGGHGLFMDRNHRNIDSFGLLSDGRLVIAYNDAIFILQKNGELTFLAGKKTHNNNAEGTGYADGVGENAKFCWINDLAVTSKDDILIADRQNCCIRKVSLNGQVTTITKRVSDFDPYKSETKPKSENHLGSVWQITLDQDDNAYCSDDENNCIWKIEKNKPEFVFKKFSSQTGGPTVMTSDKDGNLYTKLHKTLIKITKTSISSLTKTSNGQANESGYIETLTISPNGQVFFTRDEAIWTIDAHGATTLFTGKVNSPGCSD